MLNFKMTVNAMVTELSTLVNKEIHVRLLRLEECTELSGVCALAQSAGGITESGSILAQRLFSILRSILIALLKNDVTSVVRKRNNLVISLSVSLEVTKAIASGDFTTKIEIDVRDDILELETVNVRLVHWMSGGSTESVQKDAYTNVRSWRGMTSSCNGKTNNVGLFASSRLGSVLVR